MKQGAQEKEWQREEENGEGRGKEGPEEEEEGR